MRLDAAKAAAPYVHPRLAPIDGSKQLGEKEIPLVERLKAYARRDAIKASEGKVVEIKQLLRQMDRETGWHHTVAR